MVAHAHGLTSATKGDTNVLIAVPGNVNIEDQPGIHTDGGYAVVPYATTYRQNRMALDVNSLKDDVDIDDAVINVVRNGKGAGAGQLYGTGWRASAADVRSRYGKPLPFGATVSIVAQEEGTLATMGAYSGPWPAGHAESTSSA